MSLFKDAKIRPAEDDALSLLLRAFETSHKRHLVDYEDEELIAAKDGANLCAVNYEGRICWAKALCRELEKHFQYDLRTGVPEGDVYFVTLVDINGVKNAGHYGVDVRPFKRHLRRGVRGQNYIGVLEPGLYSYINHHETNVGRTTCVCWHLHLLLWGLSLKATKRLVRRLNVSGEYTAIGPGQQGAHQRLVYDFPGIVRYLLKPPKDAYRLGRRRHGVQPGDIRHKQYANSLRPGERLTAYLQLKHLTLDQLWLAGGDGKQIIGSAKRAAQSQLRRLEQRAEQLRRNRPRRHSLLSSLRSSVNR